MPGNITPSITEWDINRLEVIRLFDALAYNRLVQLLLTVAFCFPNAHRVIDSKENVLFVFSKIMRQNAIRTCKQ